VHTEAAVNTGTGEADKGAKLGRGPLRRRGVTVHAGGIPRQFLECKELGYDLENYLKQKREGLHLRQTADVEKQLMKGDGGRRRYFAFCFRVDLPHV